MCLIIYNKNGTPINNAYIKAAYENNHDGFGVMWSENGSVFTNQGLFSLKVINEILRELHGMTYACHFRYRTRGAVSAENTHPYQVLSKENDGEDLWMMHNGTFNFITATENDSDSAIFAQKFAPIIKDLGTDVLFDNFHPRRMGSKIGENNKVLFMRGDGKVSVVNNQMGFTENGKWFSNKYSLNSTYRAESLQQKTAKKVYDFPKYDYSKDYEKYWKTF